jgi:ribosomal protein L20A (L18A)
VVKSAKTEEVKKYPKYDVRWVENDDPEELVHHRIARMKEEPYVDKMWLHIGSNLSINRSQIKSWSFEVVG